MDWYYSGDCATITDESSRTFHKEDWRP